MWTIKPEFQPAEADALEALAAFIGSWVAGDPARAAGVPGAGSLLAKLSAAVKDVRGADFYTDSVAIDQPETTALVFFGRMFSAAHPAHVAHARLARWVTRFAPHAADVADYPVGRSAWHHTAKSARRVLIVSGRNRKAHRELQLWLKDLHLGRARLQHVGFQV